ncbi:MAG: AAA family ATPase [Candidatus Viridilinea halotolerans]|uniref:AAA family ATPase n=1 Tax=Candidatus Viridilinea halotolerans TaxID=2491704 RepID=A0A426U4S3_9CHLR|nr:MAG: AAA family ATPase [Candidatus Viridilinea halotolerans]
MNDQPWRFTGGEPHDGIRELPPPPSWRIFGNPSKTRGATYQAHQRDGDVSSAEIELVNAALLLRRPLLVTGKPGTGKSSLAYAVASELRLGAVLRWPITTRSILHEGLYDYDAIARLQDASLHQNQGMPQRRRRAPAIGKYIRLGPLGTALLPHDIPRVLLVDELDKSDVDLPNDLLHVFEEGEYEIRELSRLGAAHSEDLQTWDGDQTTIRGGIVQCSTFPLVIFTSNGERDFPPAFLRRCLRLEIQPPGPEELRAIVQAHFAAHLEQHPDDNLLARVEPLIKKFLEHRGEGDLSTDQLLNAVYLVTQNIDPLSRPVLVKSVWKSLSSQ